MYEFEKTALMGKSYDRDNGGTCYLYPNKNHYRVNWLSDEKRAKGYKVFSACVDIVTIPREYMADINADKMPALDDRDVVTVEFQFVTRAKTRRGIVDAATRHAYNVGPWCYIPACVSAIWGDGFDLVKDIKLGAYDRLER